MYTTSDRPFPTRNLTQLYMIALSTVAVLAILGQVLIQASLQQQSSDANIINIAGRQRMLSQKLSKASLAFLVMKRPVERMKSVQELQTATQLWYVSHLGLQDGSAELGLPGNNSMQIELLFTKIEPNFRKMLMASNDLISLIRQRSNASNSTISPFVTIILANESGFLQGMNNIVSQYQVEAQDRVTRLRQIEVFLLLSTLIVLALEGLFIFRPAIRRLDRAIQNSIWAEVQAAHSVALEQKNRELEQKNTELDLAFNEALAATQRTQPQARVVSIGHYQVQGVQGNYYNVYCHEINGQQQLVCECAVYKRNSICSHSLAAATLHSALAPYYRTNTAMERSTSKYRSTSIPKA